MRSYLPWSLGRHCVEDKDKQPPDMFSFVAAYHVVITGCDGIFAVMPESYAGSTVRRSDYRTQSIWQLLLSKPGRTV